jgi:hypothetical protein
VSEFLLVTHAGLEFLTLTTIPQPTGNRPAGSGAPARAPAPRPLDPSALTAAASALAPSRVAADAAEGGRLRAALRSLAPFCSKEARGVGGTGGGGAGGSAEGVDRDRWVVQQRAAVEELLRQCGAMRDRCVAGGICGCGS